MGLLAMNTLEHKNYRASVEYSSEDEIFVGKVLDIEALILFSADSVQGLKIEFAAAIDEYLEECKREGTEAQKPYKGTFNVRVGPEYHRRAAKMAISWGVSLNEFMRIAVIQAVDRHQIKPNASSVSLPDNSFISQMYQEPDEAVSVVKARPYN